MILILFCSKFIGVLANNYFTMKRFDKVIAKIKRCSFFSTHSVHRPTYGSISILIH